MIFDTHCHCFWNGLAHRQDELRRNMRIQNVARSVQIGTNLETSQKALKLAGAWGADAWCAIGVHPSDCQDYPENTAQQVTTRLENIIQSHRDKVVAVGETGLDYYHVARKKAAVQKRTQQVFFAAQANLARRLNLPLVIHTRSAASDTIAQIKKNGIMRAVMHCFSEDAAFARELMAWSDGIYFSFSGVLTYGKSLAVQEAARTLPLHRILVETDAPFLPPQCVRNSCKENEPAHTRYVMDFLKGLRSEPGELVEQTVWENSNSFFGI